MFGLEGMGWVFWEVVDVFFWEDKCYYDVFIVFINVFFCFCICSCGFFGVVLCRILIFFLVLCFESFCKELGCVMYLMSSGGGFIVCVIIVVLWYGWFVIWCMIFCFICCDLYRMCLMIVFGVFFVRILMLLFLFLIGLLIFVVCECWNLIWSLVGLVKVGMGYICG